MTNTKHTPGPWKACNSQVRSDRGIICNMPFITDESLIKLLERDANERLIAAAPDLLDALKICAEYVSNHYDEYNDNGAYEKACAAIAKATGKE